MTDHGFLNEMGYIWQTLSDIDGGGDFCDATFSPSPQSQSQTIRSNQQEHSSAEATPTPNVSPEKSNTDTGSPGEKHSKEEPMAQGTNDSDLE